MADTHKANSGVTAKIKAIYATTSELEALYPGRHFTPDGHMVGSIGEVIVADVYGLELLTASAKTHDAKAQDGKMVQIKATQRDRIAISSEPDYLIAIRIHADGSYEEIYNGPGKLVWMAAGPMQKNGQRSISTAKLSNLAKTVRQGDRINRR